MLKSDALSYFGTQAEFARELGRAESTISEYPPVLPLEAALLTEKLTRGKRKVNFKLYPKAPPRLRGLQ
jgi:hypothetical protein